MGRRFWCSACLWLLIAAPGSAQRAEAPIPVESMSLVRLTGQWYEIAAYGSWSHRRCMRDIVFRYDVGNAHELAIESQCATVSGTETMHGRLRQAGRSGGRLKIRFAPGFFGWLPMSWSDHWVLAFDDEYRWYVVGDDHRGRLAILSRTVAPDEASMARAIAAARAQGYDVDRLVRIPQGR